MGGWIGRGLLLLLLNASVSTHAPKAAPMMPPQSPMPAPTPPPPPPYQPPHPVLQPVAQLEQISSTGSGSS